MPPPLVKAIGHTVFVALSVVRSVARVVLRTSLLAAVALLLAFTTATKHLVKETAELCIGKGQKAQKRNQKPHLEKAGSIATVDVCLLIVNSASWHQVPTYR